MINESSTEDKKAEQDKPQLMMVKLEDVIIPLHMTYFNQYQVSFAVLNIIKEQTPKSDNQEARSPRHKDKIG